MNTKTILGIIAAVGLALHGCSKGKDDNAPNKTPASTAPKTTTPAKPAAKEPAKGMGMAMAELEPGPQGDPTGLAVIPSKKSFDDTVTALKAAVTKAKMAIVYEANHKNMMKMVGIESKSSVTIGFANPKMGNAMMKVEPRMSVAMPMRMTVRELDDGSVVVLYYKPSYLFGVFGKPPLVEMAKKKPDMMMAKFASAATGTKVSPASGPVAPPAALASVASQNSYDDTVSKLKDAVKAHGMAIVYEANHKNMMKMVGLESKPSIAIGVANPKMASNLLKLDPRAALEMPMTIAVRELDDGSVVVLFYKPSFRLSHYENPKLRAMAEKKLDPMMGMLVGMATK